MAPIIEAGTAPKRRESFWLPLVVMLCLLGSLAALVGPGLDAEFCIGKAARRVNVDAGYPELVAYVQASLQPGMTEPQVLEVLNRLAPVRQGAPQALLGPSSRTTYVVKMCWFPLNNMPVTVTYGPKGGLLSVFVPVDSP